MGQKRVVTLVLEAIAPFLLPILGLSLITLGVFYLAQWAGFIAAGCSVLLIAYLIEASSTNGRR